jgi:hypothetical protein
LNESWGRAPVRFLARSNPTKMPHSRPAQKVEADGDAIKLKGSALCEQMNCLP